MPQTTFIADNDKLVLQAQAVDETEVEMTTDGAAATASNTIVLPDNSQWLVVISSVIRLDSDPTESHVAGEHYFIVNRGANAAATEIVGSSATPYDVMDGSVNQAEGVFPVGASMLNSNGIMLDVDTTLGGAKFSLFGAADPDDQVINGRVNARFIKVF